MKKIIWVFMVSVMLISPLWAAYDADLSQTEVRTNIRDVKSVSTLPNSIINAVNSQWGEIKWFFGTIISNIFNLDGRIKNIYVDAFTNVLWNSSNNQILKWSYNGTSNLWKFIASSISEDGSGNVRIGSSTSSKNLRVYGDIVANNVTDPSGNQLWGKFIDGTPDASEAVYAWNVGIGTPNPNERLSVNGRISISTDPNTLDDVWDVRYNDARYIRKWESWDFIQDNTIDSTEIQNGTITGTDIATNTITESDIDDNFVARNSFRLGGRTLAEWSDASTVVSRNSWWDINARLFRSEYDSTNSNINYIMTQIDTDTNNYIRPSTPAQFRAAVTDNSYVNIWSSWDQIQDNTIDSSEIQNGTITWTDIANWSIADSDISSLNGDKIWNGTIDWSEIQDNTLTASDLAANSVWNSEMIDNPIFSKIRMTNQTTSWDSNDTVSTKGYVDSRISSIPWIRFKRITWQISSRNINTDLNMTSYVTYYAADQDTANFLCREQEWMQFGYWGSKWTPDSSWWAPYYNLDITAFSTDSRFWLKRLCSSWSDCYNKRTQYGSNLYCYSYDFLPNPSGY